MKTLLGGLVVAMIGCAPPPEYFYNPATDQTVLIHTGEPKEYERIKYEGLVLEKYAQNHPREMMAIRRRYQDSVMKARGITTPSEPRAIDDRPEYNSSQTQDLATPLWILAGSAIAAWIWVLVAVAGQR